MPCRPAGWRQLSLITFEQEGGQLTWGGGKGREEGARQVRAHPHTNTHPHHYIVWCWKNGTSGRCGPVLVVPCRSPLSPLDTLQGTGLVCALASWYLRIFALHRSIRKDAGGSWKPARGRWRIRTTVSCGSGYCSPTPPQVLHCNSTLLIHPPLVTQRRYPPLFGLF